jgi:DNA-binding LytR/AlgR family response regulator
MSGIRFRSAAPEFREHTVHRVEEGSPAALARLESVLDPARFLRIHRSIIVNADRIREVENLARGKYILSSPGLPRDTRTSP